MGLTLRDQPRKKWIFGIQHGSSKNWTRLHQEQFQGQIHSSPALGVWERAEACSSCPYSKGTEGWDVKGVGLEKKEKSWLTLELRAIWQRHLSLQSLPMSIHLITKWGYNTYLLKFISTEKGRIRINCIHQDYLFLKKRIPKGTKLNQKLSSTATK